MKTYVMLNGERYLEIEDAVEAAERQELESAEIYVYSDNGELVETQNITAEDNYQYHAYAVFRDRELEREEWEWYGNTEVCYNTEYEARDVVNAAAPGRYSITKVTQTVSEYVEDTDIETITIE